MEITVKDRQSLLDVAIVALGSAAAAFALVQSNNISLTASLRDGQVLQYRAADVASERVRSAYELRRLAPATDIDRKAYQALLAATSPRSLGFSHEPVAPIPPEAVLPPDAFELAVADAAAGRPPRAPERPLHLTRIFQNPFDDTFA